MKKVKRTTMCMVSIFILINSVTTMGNNTPTTVFTWDVNNLPKIESLQPVPIITKEIVPIVDIPEPQEYLAEYQYEYSANEIEILQRLAESEATGEGLIGKQWVANVVLNRIKDGRFSKKDTIKSIVFAKYQFSVITDGRYDSAIISDETIEAVESVLNGSDDSCGALYFFNLKNVKNKKTLTWINKLEFIAKIGNHSFYK